MKKEFLGILALLSLLALSTATTAFVDYRAESFTVIGATQKDFRSVVCPKVEVHPGYFVQQYSMLTSKGTICGFLGGDKPKKVIEVSVIPAAPVCHEETITEIIPREFCTPYCAKFGWGGSCIKWGKHCHYWNETVSHTETVCGVN